MRGVAEALERLEWRCARAEYEYPRLAAPDGTVAVPIGDLRLVINAASGMEAATAGETTKIGSTEGDSPTAESGDAQTPPGSDQ